MTQQPRPAFPEDALRFLTLLARPGDVFELRSLSKRDGKQQIAAGFFDDMTALARAAIECSGRADGVYITLNPVHRGLLSRLPANRVHRVGNGDSTSDRDVVARRHLLIDIDPARPAGISSDDAEHAAALELARRMQAELAALSWPEPLLADSGNGAHLIYAIDLPRDDGKLVERVLAELSRRYSTPTLKVDEKVFNPARISKIYGTLTRKGQSTPERPHRVARICSAPQNLAPIPRELLEKFAPPRPANSTRAAPQYPAAHPRFDLATFIAQHLPDAEEQAWSGGEHGQRKWLLPTCPFNGTHDRKEAFIVEMNSGAISAGCKHDSCTWGWRELREMFEPGAYDRRQPSDHPTPRPTPPEEVLYEDADYAARIEAEIDVFAARDREPAPRGGHGGEVHIDIQRARSTPYNDYGADEPATPPPWQAPTPLSDQRLLPVPAFDPDLLPPDLRPWVADIVERMQVAPDLVAVAAMAALGAVIANARTIHPKRFDTWRVSPNLWGAAIAPAGSMKTPAAAAVERVLNQLEEHARKSYEEAKLGAEADKLISAANHKAVLSRLEKAARAGDEVDRDSVVASLRQADEDRAATPKLRRIKASDATVEALIDRAIRPGRRCQPIVVWRDELIGLFTTFDRDGHEGDRKIYMEGWSVSSITVDRMARGTLFAKDFTLSVFGCATPGALGPYVREATAEGTGADGFLQRMQLLVYPDQPAGWSYVDRTPDRMAEKRAVDLFDRLFAIDEDDEHGRPPALHFDDEAQVFFDAWYSRLQNRLRDDRIGWDSEARRSHFQKYGSLMPALALVCHLASGPGMQDVFVALESAQRAARWCEYLEAHAERVYAVNDRSIEEILVDRISSGKIVGTISLRELRRKFFQARKAEDVKEAVEELERHGWVRLIKVRKALGRPSQVVEINPMAVVK